MMDAACYERHLTGWLFTNQGVYTGLSVATVSTPGLYSKCWIPDLVQLVTVALVLPEPLGGVVEEDEEPHADSPPASATAAAAPSKRRIRIHSTLVTDPPRRRTFLPTRQVSVPVRQFRRVWLGGGVGHECR